MRWCWGDGGGKVWMGQGIEVVVTRGGVDGDSVAAG